MKARWWILPVSYLQNELWLSSSNVLSQGSGVGKKRPVANAKLPGNSHVFIDYFHIVATLIIGSGKIDILYVDNHTFVKN